MQKRLSEKGHELGKILREYIEDQDTFVGTMLMLTVDQPDPDFNYQKLIDFIKSNPNVSYDEIMDKADEIVGLG